MKMGGLIRNKLIYRVSKYFPTSYLFATKGKKYPYSREGCRNHFDQVSKINIPSNGQLKITCHLTGSNECEDSALLRRILEHALNFITGKQQTSPNWKTFYKITGPFSKYMSRS